MIKKTNLVQWLPPAEAVEWFIAATEAVRLLAGMCPDPEAAEARIRAIIVDAHKQAGLPLPDWFREPAAKAFLDELSGRE